MDRKILDTAAVPAGSAAQPHEGLIVGFPLSPKPHDYPYWDSLTQTRTPLPDQLPLSYAATGDSTYWVDTKTGYVVDVNQKQTVVASIPLGDQHSAPVRVRRRHALHAEVARHRQPGRGHGGTGLFLIGSGVPAGLLALAVLLVLPVGGGLVAPVMSEQAELDFMTYLLTTWGKTWHTWPDPTTPVPLGEPLLIWAEPLLIWALTGDGQADLGLVAERDRQFGVSTAKVQAERVDAIGYEVPRVPPPESVATIGRQWTASGEDRPMPRRKSSKCQIESTARASDCSYSSEKSSFCYMCRSSFGLPTGVLIRTGICHNFFAGSGLDFGRLRQPINTANLVFINSPGATARCMTDSALAASSGVARGHQRG